MRHLLQLDFEWEMVGNPAKRSLKERKNWSGRAGSEQLYKT
jgi:hypothetical protein